MSHKHLLPIRLPVILAASALAVLLLSAPTAHAKLGESKNQLTARFGHNVRQEAPPRLGDESFTFTLPDMAVTVIMAGGRSVQEVYYTKKPLDFDGLPPFPLWEAIRAKSVPGVKWNFDRSGHCVTPDGVYTSWVEAAADRSTGYTGHIGVANYLALRGFNAVSGTEDHARSGDTDLTRGSTVALQPASANEREIKQLLTYLKAHNPDAFAYTLSHSHIYKLPGGVPVQKLSSSVSPETGFIVHLRRLDNQQEFYAPEDAFRPGVVK